MYDRLTGSTTMVISSGGTTVPGSPVRPEYLKASVYLPPAFITHNPDLHRSIINIIQHYIETVGVRTVNMWSQRARHDLHYSLTQVGNPQQNVLVNTIPSPEYNSAHYTFLGQPYRITEDLSAPPVRAPSPVGSTTSSDLSSDLGEDPDMSVLMVIDLKQHNRELQDQIHVLQQHINDLEEQVNASHRHNVSLVTLRQRAQERITHLEGQVQRFTADRFTSTSTPVRNIATHSTLPSTPSRTHHAAPQTPDASSRRHVYSSSGSSGTISHSRVHLGSPLASHPAQASPSASASTTRTAHTSASLDASNGAGLVPPGISLLSYYINLYRVRHLSEPLNLISNYAPVENHLQELLKLGLEREVCRDLMEAMALDKGN